MPEETPKPGETNFKAGENEYSHLLAQQPRSFEPASRETDEPTAEVMAVAADAHMTEAAEARSEAGTLREQEANPTQGATVLKRDGEVIGKTGIVDVDAARRKINELDKTASQQDAIGDLRAEQARTAAPEA